MTCQRFEEEGLLALERGESLDAHFETCPECLEARAAYDRLKGRLAEPPSWNPPAGWQDDVWRAIGADASSVEVSTPIVESSPAVDKAQDGDKAQDSNVVQGPWWRHPQAARTAIWAGILAATLGWMFLRPTTVPSKVGLDLQVVSGNQAQLRGDADSPQPGDRLQLTASLGDFDHAEVRVYRDDQTLILACSEDPPCRRRGDRIEADVELDAVGSYQAILAVSDQTLPSAEGSFDRDMGDLFRSGAQIELASEIEVR